MAALSGAELRAFERDGFVTIDTPLTAAQLDQAEEAWDRVRAGQVGQPAAAALEAELTPVLMRCY